MKKVKVVAILLLSAVVLFAGAAIIKDASAQLAIPWEVPISTLCILPFKIWQT